MRAKDELRQSPPASTAPASTFVHTVGRLETRPSRSRTAGDRGARAAIVMAANLPDRRGCPPAAQRFPKYSIYGCWMSIAYTQQRSVQALALMHPTLAILVA